MTPNPLKTVWDVAEETMKSPQYVMILDKNIEKVAEEMKNSIKHHEFIDMPDVPLGEDTNSGLILYELHAAAVNYCYWYGRHDVKPNDAGADKMYRLLDEAYTEAEEQNISSTLTGLFVQKLILNRFPLIGERIQHLSELRYSGGYILRLHKYVNKEENIVTTDEPFENIEDCINGLIISCPGFAQDIFLKRASLFFIMLNRRAGWFKDDMHKLPIPADYQVPKMLQWLNCIMYTGKLELAIREGELIPAGSRMECEIRASSILTCKRIAEAAGCTMADVDTFLWYNRNECKIPHHLTVTTDY